MARTPSIPGGELEHAVLTALWSLGRASAPEIYAHVGEPRSLVYTTIARVLDRLHAKKLVSRERVGKAFVYRPRARRESVEREYARSTLERLFGGAPQPAAATLVDAVEAIDPALLDELEKAIAARRRSRR